MGSGGRRRLVANPRFLSRSAAGRSRRASDALDLDPAGLLLGLGQVIGRLEPVPGIRAAAEGLIETDRHLGRDAGAAVDDVRHLLAADAELAGGRRHGKPKRLQAVVANGKARMGGVFIAMSWSS